MWLQIRHSFSQRHTLEWPKYCPFWDLWFLWNLCHWNRKSVHLYASIISIQVWCPFEWFRENLNGLEAWKSKLSERCAHIWLKLIIKWDNYDLSSSKGQFINKSSLIYIQLVWICIHWNSNCKYLIRIY